MAFQRVVEMPAFNFTTHELSAYGKSRDLGNGSEFHDCINYTFSDQPYDRLFICHPLRPSDISLLKIAQLREVLKAVRSIQKVRNDTAMPAEKEAREKSITIMRKALSRRATGLCVIL